MRRKERGRDSGLKKRRDKSKGRTKRERGGEEGEEWRMEETEQQSPSYSCDRAAAAALKYSSY